jgi:hypothetical protein
MNGTEQKNHRTVTQDLSRAVEVIANSTAQRLEAHGVELVRLRESIGAERTHRLDLAKEQRGYVDNQDQLVGRRVDALASDLFTFQHRGFWSRLNWLVTGR